MGSQFGVSVSIVEPAFVVSNLQAAATDSSEKSSVQSIGFINKSQGVTEKDIKAMYSQQYNSDNIDNVAHNTSLANGPEVTTWAITVSSCTLT